MALRRLMILLYLSLLTVASCQPESNEPERLFNSAISCDPLPEGTFDDSVVPGGAEFVEYSDDRTLTTTLLVADKENVLVPGDVYEDLDGGFKSVTGTLPDADSLKQWLDDRINYIIAETIFQPPPGFNELIERTVSIDEPFNYPRFQNFNASIVASNSGAYLYEVGKVYDELHGFRLPQASDYLDAPNDYINFNFTADVDDPTQTIRLTSPRAGIIEVGPGLYATPPNPFGPTSDLTPFARQIDRVGVLFHEARHSDGKGNNLGFPHVLCPAGFGGLTGLYACDVCTNGAYSVGAQYYMMMVRSCSNLSNADLVGNPPTTPADCNSTDITYLQFLAADSAGRLLE